MATGERVERKEGGDAGDVVASSAGGADAAQGAAEGGDERDFVAFERQGKGGSSKRRKAKLNDSSARLGHLCTRPRRAPTQRKVVDSVVKQTRSKHRTGGGSAYSSHLSPFAWSMTYAATSPISSSRP